MIYIPKPHGRIIDADKLADDLEWDAEKIREELAPLFSKYNVSLVLQGHDHLYSKTYPVNAKIVNNNIEAIGNKDAIKISYSYNDKNYQVYNGYEGTIYLNSGSSTGSKYYSPIEGMYSKDIIEDTSNPSMVMYSNITFTEDALLIDTYTMDTEGNTTLYKSFGMLNEKRDIPNPVDPVDPVNPVDPTKPKNNIVLLILSIVGPSILVLGGAIVFVLIRNNKRRNK